MKSVATGDLQILPVSADDVPELTAVMTRAFDDDARRHQGLEKGGPPGYDTGAFIRRWGLHKAARSYKAVRDGAIVGCIIVFPGNDGHHRVGNVFTDPACQRQGIGRALMTYAEKAFPGKSWTLETPAFAVSNHSFYEQTCGYVKTGETDSGSDGPGVEYVYRKDIRIFE
jgi:ribosomal protein S18 acetylase RimI-like enzyme